MLVVKIRSDVRGERGIHMHGGMHLLWLGGEAVWSPVGDESTERDGRVGLYLGGEWRIGSEHGVGLCGRVGRFGSSVVGSAGVRCVVEIGVRFNHRGLQHGGEAAWRALLNQSR